MMKKYLIEGVDDNAGYWPGHSAFEEVVYASSRKKALEKLIKESKGGSQIFSIDSIRKIK